MNSSKLDIVSKLHQIEDTLYSARDLVLDTKVSPVNAWELRRLAQQLQEAETLLTQVLEDEWWS